MSLPKIVAEKLRNFSGSDHGAPSLSGDAINAYLNERGALVHQARSLVDDAERRGEWTSADEDAFSTIHSEIERVDKKVGSFRASLGAGYTTGPEIEGDVLTTEQRMTDWYSARHGVSVDERAAREGDFNLGRVVGSLLGKVDRRDLTDLEQRALSEGVDASGGFLVPEYLSARLIDRVRAKAQVMNAGALVVPMQSDTTNLARLVGGASANWKAENADVDESDMTYERVQLKTKTAVVLQRLSVELYEDLDDYSTIQNEIVQSLALKLDAAALRGDPSADTESPRGVRFQTGVNLVDMGTDGATPDDWDFLIDAIAAIRDSNGEPNAAIMASRTQTTLDKLKDSTGQPLQMPQVVGNLRRLTSNQIPVDLVHGASPDNKSEAYVADWSTVLIGVRPSINLRFRVLQERYMDKLQYGLIAWLRADVAMAHPEHASVVVGIKP